MRQKSYDDSPSLYLIPTPVGNMEDITFRTINTLKMVDLLLCEDTRVTAELLHKLGIRKKLIHSDDHTEENLKEMVLSKLQGGLNIGLVTDRGTPVISDPGYKIVEFISHNGFNVISLPGPTAFVPALTMSGLHPSPFVFYGFLNSKEARRIKELDNLKKLPYTIIFYEAPHRICDMLKSLLQVFGNRKMALCREISKKYEEVVRGTIEEVLEVADTLKGEMVVVVEGNLEPEDFSSMTILEHIHLYLEDGISEKEVIKKVAVERGIPKSVVYKEYHVNNSLK
ncbi:MAG: 16S rRNA (cytidine(1402)-2'-O)-methyltransferase [bacterium]|nr:16S rRNA (cytidine(1402)-2'-O)-methyltransferase [bacterium]